MTTTSSSNQRGRLNAQHRNCIMPRLYPCILRTIILLLAASFIIGCSDKAKKKRIQARADDYFRAGELEKASVEYLNLLRAENQSPTAMQQLGFIWMKEGAPLRAVPLLLKARELMPDNTEA